MIRSKRPTLGIAMSGSGNRSTFYIGFLEVLDELKIPVDYISACSGGSVVAAAYAGGALEPFKEEVMALSPKSLRQLFSKSQNGGGLYSFEIIEEKIRNYIHGLHFEDSSVKMAFVAADIESGEQVVLCMGDIARAACISCALPGAFEPVKWGARTLVDGGLLSLIPTDVIRQAGIDVVVGINLRGNKGIFSMQQLELKQAYNTVKYLFFFEEIEKIFRYLLSRSKEHDPLAQPGILTVLGKSLEVARKNNHKEETKPDCDLLIDDLGIIPVKGFGFTNEMLKQYYELGRKTAYEYAPRIQALIEEKIVASSQK